jgi:mono/diheme cytochrome c family protein
MTASPRRCLRSRFDGRLAARVAVPLAAMLIGMAGVAQAQSGDAAEVERGRTLFMANGCYSCHGTAGQGGERSGAPKLAPQPYPFEAFKVLVREPREAMPRFDPRYLSDAQLQAIHTYLSSIPKGVSAKDILALRE